MNANEKRALAAKLWNDTQTHLDVPTVSFNALSKPDQAKFIASVSTVINLAGAMTQRMADGQ